MPYDLSFSFFPTLFFLSILIFSSFFPLLSYLYCLPTLPFFPHPASCRICRSFPLACRVALLLCYPESAPLDWTTLDDSGQL